MWDLKIMYTVNITLVSGIQANCRGSAWVNVSGKAHLVLFTKDSTGAQARLSP